MRSLVLNCLLLEGNIPCVPMKLGIQVSVAVVSGTLGHIVDPSMRPMIYNKFDHRKHRLSVQMLYDSVPYYPFSLHLCDDQHSLFKPIS
jgi:hypothetical protein